MRKLRELARKVFGFVHTHRKAMTAALVAIIVIAPIAYVRADGDLFNEFSNNPTDTILLFGAAILNGIAAFMGQVILLLINALIVPILGYNGFANSNVIGLGWSLVRDIVNMFVVVILLVMAVMTIVGYHKANWTQQLPRLFIAVLLVNFSRTICGFLIDVSQVIMFTFVNAIIDIAAGNFAQMLGLIDFGTFDSKFIEKANERGDGLDAAALFMAALFQVPLYLAIAAVMFLMAVAFIWRIVVLWMAVIMAPMAFFMISARDLFTKAGGVYTEWWSKFSAALILGPVLAFFIWLSLAASSGTNLAKSENLPMPKEDDKAVSGIPLKQASVDNFTGTLLALVFLILGMSQAAGFAGALGGWAAKALGGDGMARGTAIVKGAMNPRLWGRTGVELASKAAPGAVGAVGRGLAGAGARIAGIGGATAVAGKLTSKLGDKGVGGWVKNKTVGAARVVDRNTTGALGGAVAGVGNYSNAQASKAKEAKRKEAMENLKGFSDNYREQVYASMATDGALYNSLSSEERAALTGSFLSSTKDQKKAQDALKKQFAGQTNPDGSEVWQTKYNQMVTSRIKGYEADSDKDKYGLDDGGKKALNAFKTQNLHLLEDPDNKLSQADYAKKFVSEASKKGEFDPRVLSKDAVQKDYVQAALAAEKSAYVDKDGNPINMLDAAKQGRYGSSLADAFRPDAAKMSATTFAVPAALPAGAPAADVEAHDKSVKDIASKIEALAKSDQMSKLDRGSLDELKKAVADARVRDNLSVTANAQVDSAILKAEEKVGGGTAAAATATFGTLPGVSGGSISATVAGRIEQVVHSDPISIRFLANEIPAAGSGLAHTEVSRAAYEGITKESLKDLQKKIMSSTGDELKKATAAFDEVKKLIEAQKNELAILSAAGTNTTKQEKALKSLEQVRDQTQRYVR